VNRQLQEIWRYRQLLWELFLTWLKLRHTGSILGVVWTLLNPAVFVLTYWIVFTHVIRLDIPSYAAFLIPGYLAWSFTWTAINAASESVVQSSYLITKVAFPSEVLVLASVGVALFDFIVGLVIYLVVAAVLGVSFPPLAAAVPIMLFLHVAFTLGLCFVAATGSVFFRDIPKLISIAGFLLFFATPVFYPESMVPPALGPLYGLNPFLPFISLYQHAFYFSAPPSEGRVLAAVLLSALSLAGGLWMFGRHKATFAEFS
jgi:ABC-type polysaccharide/polyol phosphate export permease